LAANAPIKSAATLKVGRRARSLDRCQIAAINLALHIRTVSRLLLLLLLLLVVVVVVVVCPSLGRVRRGRINDVGVEI